VTLINADSNKPIAGYEALADGATLHLSQLPTRRLNLCFNAPEAVKTLSFTLPGCALRAAGTEKGRPFSLGNDKADFKPWTPAKGAYLLTIIPYADNEMKKAGPAKTWRFRVEE
jgi:hypothetical protein